MKLLNFSLAVLGLALMVTLVEANDLNTKCVPCGGYGPPPPATWCDSDNPRWSYVAHCLNGCKKAKEWCRPPFNGCNDAPQPHCVPPPGIPKQAPLNVTTPLNTTTPLTTIGK